MNDETGMSAKENLGHSSFGIPSSFAIRASSFCSFIQKGEHQFCFGDDCVVHDTMTFRFRQSFTARFGELRVYEDRVTRQHWFAKFYFVRAHEIADTARGFRQFKQQNARDLGHRFYLHYAWHHRMTGEMSLKERLVNRDRFHADTFGFRFETDNAIDHEKWKTVR